MAVKTLHYELFNNYFLILFDIDGTKKLVLRITVNFKFKDKGSETWTETGKRDFIKRWEKAVELKWNDPNLYTSKTQGKVAFEVNVVPYLENDSKKAMWALTVTKIKSGEFSTSSVSDGFIWNSSVGDSEDLTPVWKGSATEQQRAAVHEFGHMIGLDDEYPSSMPWGLQWTVSNKTDHNSIMHSGETIRKRHLKQFRDWVKGKLGE